MTDTRFQSDEWKIIETRFEPGRGRDSESIFALGNGMMGQRANFEETYTGDTLQGSYIAGVYYPDKTVVGWWKVGYPEYFAKVPNAPSWTGIIVRIDGEELDLAKCEVRSFRRELDMRQGLLTRTFTAVMPSGRVAEVVAERFLSMHEPEKAAIRYSVRITGGGGKLELIPWLNADVFNEDANYDERFWENESSASDGKRTVVVAQTRKTAFVVATAMENAFALNGKPAKGSTKITTTDRTAHSAFTSEYADGDTFTVTKYAAVLSSFNHPVEGLTDKAMATAGEAAARGFDAMLADHRGAWEKKWEHGDIVIKGDIAAQQGIRFNIFQLNQTYTGEDPRLNIGPKGFTGEKYGGSTYWDTEAFVFPFYLSTADTHVARNLLIYRYKHLDKAIENAQKLGFTNGAALYPMVTMNGEECHNEWEITFEEIHRNGAIAFAIFNYVRHTGDQDYLAEYGLEVLIAISRFWAQRSSFSQEKNQYVILGVTGPNEYENNVNNNWYTNTLAHWTLKYTSETLEWLKSTSPVKYNSVVSRTRLDTQCEMSHWKEIINNVYFPVHHDLGIFLQQDGFMDKVQQTVKDLDQAERPLNQHWSWDRILRSVFIKQADVLQGIYFFEDEYTEETIRRNFDFYEPRCVHESSLSASIHSVLAARLHDTEIAYTLYLRTARLDLDDYNREVKDGLHITSMAGTWLAIVEGFGGMRIRNDRVCFNPVIPAAWESFSFIIRYRNNPLRVEVNGTKVNVVNLSAAAIPIAVYGEQMTLQPGEEKRFDK
ncbi:MAG: family 65 glycosyl hydrolase domain-containing protein [Bacteroidales bacterium]|jgi:maltose phosphorylase|nr:family 65 glycosyl hydrolase domain-containing protein [Bacteroidales bacterium]